MVVNQVGKTTRPGHSGLAGGTPDLFRSAVPLLIDLLVPIPHLLAPLNQFAAEFVAFALIQPLLAGCGKMRI